MKCAIYFIPLSANGSGDGSAGHSVSSLIGDFDADGALSGGHSRKSDGEGDGVLSSGQGARASGNSEAGITGGQREGRLSTSLSNGDNGGQASDGASGQDVEVQSELITDMQIARRGRALGDVQAGWAGESIAGVEGDIGGQGRGHEGSDQDKLEHIANGMAVKFQLKMDVVRICIYSELDWFISKRTILERVHMTRWGWPKYRMILIYG